MTLTIPDVSEHQGQINWPTLAAACPAVIVRAHNGSREDIYWRTNAAQASNLLRWWGAYQYADVTKSPTAQRQAFEASLVGFRPHVRVVDVEVGAGDLSAWTNAWLAAGAGSEWTYSGLWFFRQHLAGVMGGRWIAAYQATEPTDAHVLWQSTSSAHFPGVTGNVDASQFHGTLADLLALTDGLVSTSGSTTLGVFMALTDAQQQQMYDWLRILDFGLDNGNPIPFSSKGELTARIRAIQAAVPTAAEIATAVVAALPPAQSASVDPTVLAKAVADELERRLAG